MRVNKITEITVIMACIDVLVQYMDCTLQLHYHSTYNGVLQYYCNTGTVMSHFSMVAL